MCSEHLGVLRDLRLLYHIESNSLTFAVAIQPKDELGYVLRVEAEVRNDGVILSQGHLFDIDSEKIRNLSGFPIGNAVREG